MNDLVSDGPVDETTAALRVASSNESRESRRQCKSGVTVSRHFTKAGEHPFDHVEWEIRSARISIIARRGR